MSSNGAIIQEKAFEAGQAYRVRFSLSLKLVITVTALVVMVTTAFSIVVFRQGKKILFTIVRENALALAENFALDLEYGMLTGNHEELSRQAETILRHEGVWYCRMLDAEGAEVMQQTRTEEAGLTVPRPQSLNGEQPVVRLVEGNGGWSGYDVVVPIMSVGRASTGDEMSLFGFDQPESTARESIGRLQMGFSLARAWEWTGQILRAIMITAGIVILFVAVSVIVLARVILKPISRLVQGTRRLAGGDLSVQVPVRSHDEIGVLSLSFNDMAKTLSVSQKELRESKEQLEGWSRDLENKVDERTDDLMRAQKAMVRILADLEESKSYVENIVQNLTDALVVLNMNSSIDRINPMTTRILGFTEQDLIGRLPSDILGIEESLLRQVVEAGSVENQELLLSRKDGSQVPVLLSAFVVHDNDSKANGIVLIMKDITERKEAEKSLRMYVEKVEKINKELDDFTYIVSHDLKEPLRSLDAFSRFLEEDYKDKVEGEGKMYLERIRSNASRMQKLIEDLLEISRLDRSQNPHAMTPVREMVDECLFRLEYSLKDKNVECIVPDDLPVICCDRIRLTEVFLNLMSNAVKFMDKPQSRLEIGWTKTNREYTFRVADNGPGIEEEYFEKIFKIFQRLKKKEEAEGTGVGLTIVRKVVEMHGGRVWLESKVGEGTTFFFTIPVRKSVDLA